MGNFKPKSLKDLKSFLDEQASVFEQPDFLNEDPLGIVRQFSSKQDQEIIGLLGATIAWGNRASILKSMQRILEIMDQRPFDFILNTNEKDWVNLNFVHRTFNAEDLKFFMSALKCCYQKSDSLESYFVEHAEIPGVKGRIVNFREQILQTPHLIRTQKHLSNPEQGSASKRLNMFLRWMVRSNEKEVDLGLWKGISPSELRIPLDVHTARVARKLGFLKRNQNDWKALEEIHATLDILCPEDPAKYDFALFGLGVSGF